MVGPNSGRITCFNPRCPNPHMAQKVSVMVDSGTSLGIFASTIPSYPALAGTAQTRLAQMLSCPPRPTYRSVWGCGIIGVLVTLYLFGIVGFGYVIYALTSPGSFCTRGVFANTCPSSQDIASIATSYAIFGLLFIGGAIALSAFTARRAAKRRSQNEVEMRRWEIARQHWDRLYYCHTCGSVFNPSGPPNAYVPVNQMYLLL